MKTITTTLFLFINLLVFAQNWSILDENKTYFYRHSDSLHISNTVHIDSVLTIDSLTTYYTSFIYKECDTCTYYPPEIQPGAKIIYQNASDFLGHEVTINNQNETNINGNIIKPLSNIGDIWNFNDDLTATNLSHEQIEIFNQLDSIKIIVLSSNDTIILSQYHGILQYPDFENTEKYFYLEGYHHEQESYGEYEPNFWRIYDFEIGDRFCFYRSPAQVSSDPVADRFYCQYNIYDKQISGDSLTFEGQKLCIRHVDTPDGNFGPFYTNSLFSKTIVNNSKTPENIFGIRPIDDGLIDFYDDPFYGYIYNTEGGFFQNYYVSQNYFSEEFGVLKSVKLFIKLDNDSLLYEKNYYCNDDFYIPLLEDIDNAEIMIFADKYGKIFSSQSEGFGGCIYQELIGGIIAGDSIGIVCDFSTDLSIQNNTFFESIVFSPNPANSIITTNKELEHIQIFSSLGKLILDLTNPTKNIDISQLPNGLVVIIAKGRNEEHYSSKILIER